MNRRRRQLLRMLSGAITIGAMHAAQAQDYPSRVVKIIVPTSPGGIVDVEVRRLAVHLARALGQPVIVDNRPGASNTIGTAIGAKGTPGWLYPHMGKHYSSFDRSCADAESSL